MTKAHADELTSLDLLPPNVAKQRTDALLRNLLASPPDPHAAAKKPAKRSSKKPRKK